MIIEQISRVLATKQDLHDKLKIWYIKEVLQAYILSYIYSHVDYGQIIFYGGTALRFCHDLDRLSEDLDFVGVGFSLQDELWHDLKKYFSHYWLTCDIKRQKFRTTLKFRNILKHFNLSFGNSIDLYVKIEISTHFDFATDYKEEFFARHKYGQSILIRSFRIEDLMWTKLNAVLYRAWTNERQGVSFKGRDIYDLYRYLAKKVKPTIGCIEWVESYKQLKDMLTKKIKSINFSEAILDIQSFIENEKQLPFFKEYAKTFMLWEIAKW